MHFLPFPRSVFTRPANLAPELAVDEHTLFLAKQHNPGLSDFELNSTIQTEQQILGRSWQLFLGFSQNVMANQRQTLRRRSLSSLR
jgi:hypothetical protein